MLLKLDGTTWVQAYPEEEGEFDCDPDGTVAADGPGRRPGRARTRTGSRRSTSSDDEQVRSRGHVPPVHDHRPGHRRACTASPPPGLVVTYTTSGIFNFAHGAVAMLGAFTYWQLRCGWGWPAPIALLVVLGVLAPLLGAALYGVVMRGLRDTSEVARDRRARQRDARVPRPGTWIWDPTPRTPAAVPASSSGPTSTVTRRRGQPRPGTSCWRWSSPSSSSSACASCSSGHPHRAWPCGPWSTTPTCSSSTAAGPSGWPWLSWALGAFLAALAGVLITPDPGLDDERHRADPARHRRLRRRHVRPAAQRAAHVRRRPRARPRRQLRRSATSRPTSGPGSATSGSSLPMIVLFVVLLVLPQDRLRGATVLRTRERFRMPSMRNARDRRGGARRRACTCVRELLAPTAINTLAFGMTASRHRPVARAAHRLRRRDQPGRAVVRRHRGDRRLPLRGRRAAGSDARSTLLGYVLAAVVCALVGALVALPALRLRGLYLALATMAFGVFVSNMILREIGDRQLPLLHTRFTHLPQRQPRRPPARRSVRSTWRACRRSSCS